MKLNNMKNIEWKKSSIDIDEFNQINHKDLVSAEILKQYRRPDLGGKASAIVGGPSKAGKVGGPKTYELGIGLHGLSEEEQKENASKGGKVGGHKTYELGIGLFALSDEERSVIGAKANRLRKHKGHPPTTPINVYDYKTNEFIREYPSISECARDMNLHKGNIGSVTKGKTKQHKGYRFEYKNTI